MQYSNGKHKRVTSRSDKFKYEILFKSYVSGIVFKMQKKFTFFLSFWQYRTKKKGHSFSKMIAFNQ